MFRAANLLRPLMYSAMLLAVVNSTCTAQSGGARRAPEGPSNDSSPESPPTSAELDQWIANLDADQYAVREQASRMLRQAGRSALARLAKTADQHDAEASARAVAILDEWAHNDESSLQLDALKGLAALKRHPAVGRRAKEQLSRYDERNALRKLKQLGARVTEELFVHGRAEQVPLKIVVGDDWKGTDDDLAQLRHLQTVRTVGIRYFRVRAKGLSSINEMSSLSKVELYGTDVDSDALAQLKKAMPHVEFDVRRGAMLGIGGSIGGGPAVVDHVEPGTAAQKAGLQPGDVVQEIDGKAVATFSLLTLEISKYEAGDQTTLTIDRAGQKMTKKVKFGRWP